MEQNGLRGSAPARIDDKGRLKIPTVFRSLIQDGKGPDVFVTSLDGACVRIYPMPVWLEIEGKLSAVQSSSHFVKGKTANQKVLEGVQASSPYSSKDVTIGADRRLTFRLTEAIPLRD